MSRDLNVTLESLVVLLVHKGIARTSFFLVIGVIVVTSLSSSLEILPDSSNDSSGEPGGVSINFNGTPSLGCL